MHVKTPRFSTKVTQTLPFRNPVSVHGKACLVRRFALTLLGHDEKCCVCVCNMYGCMSMSMYLIHVYVYVSNTCMYVCVCMYVFMYPCMYTYVSFT